MGCTAHYNVHKKPIGFFFLRLQNVFLIGMLYKLRECDYEVTLNKYSRTNYSKVMRLIQFIWMWVSNEVIAFGTEDFKFSECTRI